MKKYSIIQKDMNRCYVCDKLQTHKHEIFFGKNHNNSIKYGLVVGLCLDHHTGYNGVHTSRGILMNNQLRKIGQQAFMDYYDKSKQDFIKIFKSNYL